MRCNAHYPPKEIPMSWRSIFLLIALGKASVAGATVALALLGSLNIAFAVTLSEWLTEIQQDALFNYFAIGGGLAGMLWQGILSILNR